MAATSRLIRVIEIVNNLPQYKNYDSKTLELMLKSVSVTSDNGTTVLTISESSGAFAFGNKKLTGVAQPTVEGEAVALSTGGKIASGLLPDLSGTYIAVTEKGANSGVATLDAGGKIPSSQLPSSVMDFLGAWDASTNTPTLADGTGNAGDVYRASVAGDASGWMTDTGPKTFAVGDWIMYNGTKWQHSPATDAVTSVAGKTGAVTLAKGDVGLTNVDDVQQLPMSYLDTDAALTANSDLKVASQKATKAYADTKVPQTTTVNGHALSGNVTVTKADVGLTNVDDVQQLPMSYLDTDGTLAANSDVKVPSQKAVKTYVASQLGSTSYAPFTNKEGGSTAHTVGQVVFYDGVAGGMKKAIATGTLLPTTLLAMVKDASIADDASGQYYFPRRGTVVGGFTGLTVGQPQYISRTTAGALATDLTGFTTSDHVVFVGWAVSATEILFCGEYQYQIA